MIPKRVLMCKIKETIAYTVSIRNGDMHSFINIMPIKMHDI